MDIIHIFTCWHFFNLASSEFKDLIWNIENDVLDL